jgi:hypothetical protein
MQSHEQRARVAVFIEPTNHSPNLDELAAIKVEFTIGQTWLQFIATDAASAWEPDNSPTLRDKARHFLQAMLDAI